MQYPLRLSIRRLGDLYRHTDGQMASFYSLKKAMLARVHEVHDCSRVLESQPRLRGDIDLVVTAAL